MRIIKFSRHLFSQTEKGNYFSRLFNCFCSGRLWDSLPETGWGLVKQFQYTSEDGDTFTREDLVAVVSSLSEAREILASDRISERVSQLTEQDIDELIASL
jgi:hypothetical protein